MGSADFTYRRSRYGDPETEALSQSVSDVFGQLADNPILNGQLLKGVTLKAGAETPVPHRLGRRPKGVIVVGQSAASDIHAGPSANADVLAISSTAAVTADLWVF